MAQREQLPRALVALGEVAGQLVRRSSSGKVALARLADVLPPGAIPDAIRGEVVSRLASAREEVLVPLAFKQVEKTLKSAWDQAPAKVLDEIDPEPLAVRAGAQVHAGELDGRPVAIKVLRPGLAASVRADLVTIDVLAGPLGSLFPGTDVGAFIRVAREMGLEELDLEHEAGQQRQVRRALRGLSGSVVVPETFTDLAAAEVMVSERLDGPTLEQAEPEDPSAAARAILTAHLTAWRLGGLALTDPKPGHVVLLGDGRVGLLGTGVARAADPARAGAVIDALVALRDDDAEAFAELAHTDLGVLSLDDGRDAHRLAAYALGDLVRGPARLDEAALAASAERLAGRLGVFLRLGARATPDPDDLAPARMIGQLVLLLSRLRATEDWARLAA
jgi:ubiquinone biosynthesis protein